MQRSPKSAPRADRLRAEREGRRAENWAALLLQLKFFTIVERRYRTPVGEIDLIAQGWGTTVFIEVKARRRGAAADEALEAVNQRRITAAAQFYLARHPQLAETSLRFDVILLQPWRWPVHIRNAFEASGG